MEARRLSQCWADNKGASVNRAVWSAGVAFFLSCAGCVHARVSGPAASAFNPDPRTWFREWIGNRENPARERSACDTGDPFACFRIAVVTERDLGDSVFVQAADGTWQEAGGSRRAREQHARDIEAAWILAAHLLDSACDQGNLYACGTLGYAYGAADPIRDLERAHTFQQKACKGGIAWACDAR
jgi:hypothetical protein